MESSINLSESCSQNLDFYKACRDYQGSLNEIFSSLNPHLVLRNLKFGKVLFKIIPEIEQMNFIYQDKKKNSLLFDHSVKVLEFTYERTQYKSTLIAAFFHDYGKIFTEKEMFKKHDSVGLSKVPPILSKYGIEKETIKEIKVLMANHPRASQYQRSPNWNNQAVLRFIKQTHPLTLETISLARADKKASHNFDEYLKPYDDLKDRCLELFRLGIEV